MHEQNIICNKTHLDSTTHEQTVICRQLIRLFGQLLANEKEEKNTLNDNYASRRFIKLFN